MTDMVRIYVVEKLPKSDNPQDEGRWLTVGTYDDPADAGRHAADLKPFVTDGSLRGARVRQFWVESTPTTPKALPGKPEAKVVPLIELTCTDHPEYRVSVHDTARAPKCRYCGKGLVTPSFEDAIRSNDIVNLEDIK